MKTTQDLFHPMRGHVDDGCVIKMRNGEEMTVRGTMNGWQLVHADGRHHSAPSHSAYDLARIVNDFPADDIA